VTDKALVIEAVQKLPDSSSLQDIRREIEFMAAVQEGLEQIRRGEVVPLDTVEKKLREQWASK
jgi:predicted transcriptional regulator